MPSLLSLSRTQAWLVLIIVAAPVALIAGPRLDLEIVDQQFRLLRQYYGVISVDQDPVVVGIDEQTYQEYEWPFGLWHPYFGQFLKAMAVAKAKAVVMDVVLPQKPLPETLTRFADNGQYVYHDDILLEGVLDLSDANIPLIIAEAPDESGTRIIRGYSDLLSLMTSLDDTDRFFGMAQVLRDPDGVFRRYAPYVADRPSLATATLIKLDEATVPREEGTINFLLGGTAKYVPLHTLTGWFNEGNVDVLTKTLSDRVVLLGVVTSTQDRKPLPVRILDPSYDQSNLYQPGVIVHFQALRTYLQQRLIHSVDPWLTNILALMLFMAWWFSANFRSAVLTTLAAGMGLIGLSTILLLNDLRLGVGSAVIILAVAVIGRLAFESMQAFQERRQLKSTFSGYVSPPVLSLILDGEISADYSGETRRVCVLFSDIRGFTARSENQNPRRTISLLNRYFEQMVDCVHRHEGTVDKFIGDGLMAFFGAPNSLDNSARQGINAARDMLDSLKQLNRQLQEEGEDPLAIGIGLHYGEVVIGHVGSPGRHEYTAIGDTVNVAARLESLTRDLGYPILMSQEFTRVLGEDADWVDLGRHPLKGHSGMHLFAVDSA